MQEIEQIKTNAISSLKIIQDLKNKITSNLQSFKIDFANETQLRKIIETITKDSENAKQVFKIFDNYKTEMEQKTEHTDKYYHTKANCDSAKLGVLQASWATFFSIGKELKDYKYKIENTNMTKKAIIKDCLQDLDVDFQGLMQGLVGKNCEIKAIEMEEKYPYH